VRRLALLALAVWIVRWALMEIAGRLGPHVPRAPDPVRSPRQPGRLPGPFDT
jgi:hypothetical protein